MSTPIAECLAEFDPNLPLERAKTIPNSWYFDPAIERAERDAVFFDSWQVVGRAEQVATTGAFLTAEIAGQPILVVCDERGILRAFYNVCRHRAAQVINEPCGVVSKLRCRYHGWTYDLSGRLRGTPEFEGVEDFCKDDHGLPEIAVAVWGPFVWVHLAPPQIQLEEFLAPLPAWALSHDIQKLHFAMRQQYDLDCNWKVYVDNYLDGGYHVNTVHPGLAGVLDYREYRTTIHGQTSLQSSPIKAASDADPTAARTRTGSEASYWWVFPNFMLNHYEGVMDTNLVLPLGPSRCRVIFDFYFAETEGTVAQDYMAQSMKVAHQIQLEDMGVCAEVQRGLASRSFTTGRFSVRREIAGYHFHQLLGRRLQAYLGDTVQA